MKIKIFLVLFILLVSKIEAQNIAYPKPRNHWVNSNLVNKDWLYLEVDSETIPAENDTRYQSIDLPHTWNSKDVLQTKDYRRAGSWYRKHLYFDTEELDTRKFLRFNAAGQEAKVYVNKESLMHHMGGYSAFTVDLTKHLKKGKNTIDVWVSNAPNASLAPISGDFNFYGGLYRSVELISAPKVSFSRNYYGGPGFRIWGSEVSSNKANINLKAILDNFSDKTTHVTIKAIIKNKKGKVVSKGTLDIKLNSGKSISANVPMSLMSNPELWSPETPYLYDVDIKLFEKNKKLDAVSTKLGVRWYEFTVDKGFFLNGKPYKLKGANRHQDYFAKGNALTPETHLNDIKLMKEVGVNWLRLAHYQQDDYMLQLCDELGILVWEEIPYVNNTPKNKDFEGNLHTMMKELIEQHYNHPSIILWGMGNETWMSDRGDGKASNYDIVKGLNALIHREDSTRKTVFVNGDNNKPIDFGVVFIPDVFGFNLYRGWYRGEYNSLTERLNELHKLAPNVPLILSEFGVGSDERVHTENPQKQDFSIEYHNDYLESHLEQIDKLNWLCGVNYWAFADFGAAHRGDTKPHINQKGLVTFNRKKKDAFYLLKSKWSKEPVVYIESPFWTERSGNSRKDIRVFSNMKEVELFLNGKSLGKQNNTFVWTLTLNKGKNTLKAIGNTNGTKREHQFVVNYKKNRAKYAISASSEDGGHNAKHAIDGNLKTKWQSGNSSEIIIDLKKISLVNGVKIAFDENELKTYNLNIEGSVDKKTWMSLLSGKSNKRAPINTFLFKKQQEIQYIKILAKGNNKDAINSYLEIIPITTFEKAEKNLYEIIGAGGR
ncbi:glycoside hydrolase family 2 protein [Flavivirga algicola]|uniref:DUF4982 domain-containing protein n=1 Tax=Flavivirga algicola TaxID=2729136 RepID=A0ABX1RTJ0_9FLAO|nr:glycoside hydrolase family 2 TIM barrel-domain containing protein [Flavivirga algicola]NMH86862.1 DUF4982 domain-containing protein [Flavivirga algicola]